MKNRIICLLLVLVMCFSFVALTACNKDDTPDNGGENNGENNGNNNGNKPDDDKEPDDGEEDNSRPPIIGGGEVDDTAWWEEITYDETELRFQMTHCTNNQELPSGCERYLAGESNDNEDIDKLIGTRNDNAESLTLIKKVHYAYYDDIQSEYGYSRNINRINVEVSDKNANTPDMYCNFLTDMLCTSLLGSFANLYSRERGGNPDTDPDTYGKNYFNLEDPGYMSDLMGSLTLSLDKIYVIASDYFLDLIRAFFVVPVNVNLYNRIAEQMLEEDYDGDGFKDINDFFYEVMEGKWTYARVAEYAAKAYVPAPGNTAGASINDTLGFVLADNGLPAAAMVYTTTTVTVISKTWNPDRGDYDYAYPDTNEDLVDLANALNSLFSSKGVKCVTGSDASSVGESTPLLGCRKQFTTDKILFGGVILVGSLEYSDYQRMKEGNSGGFGVVPVPIYKYNDELDPDQQYLTQIHVVGRGGAIAVCTAKFAQCTAFLHYQSSHSTEILNEYYDYNLTYDTASGLDGNVEMLQYIRENVRTSFDKLFEDAIGFFYETVDDNSDTYRWHSQIVAAKYQLTNMRDVYDTYVGAKKANLANLIEKVYPSLPD